MSVAGLRAVLEACQAANAAIAVVRVEAVGDNGWMQLDCHATDID